jgi:hypothetical protein
VRRFGFAHLGANQKLRKKVRFRGIFGYGNAVSFFSKRCMSAKKSDIACFVEVPLANSRTTCAASSSLAFPWEEAPRYVLRDRDAIYGRDFADMTRDMGMEEVLTAPRSPWQNPFLERLVGFIRREWTR